MVPARNRPNPVDQESPIKEQDRNVTISTGDSAKTYDLNVRNKVHIGVASGEIEVKFFDKDGNELTPSLIINSSDPFLGQGSGDGDWSYDWQDKQSTPSEIRITANIDNSEYDILIERV